jgi:catechol 2,3-dioxygenase-like lactoylglutathione lyase family enzyme
MLDHISLGVTSIERAIEFYDATLRPLGYVRVWSDLRPGEQGEAVGYGLPGGEDELALKRVSRAGPVSTPGFR